MSNKKPQSEAEYETRNKEYPYLPIWPKRHGHIFVPHGDGWEPAEVALARENSVRSGRLRPRTSRPNDDSENPSTESSSSQSTKATKDSANEKNKKATEPEKNMSKLTTPADKQEIIVSIKYDTDQSSGTATQPTEVAVTPAESAAETAVEPDKGDSAIEIGVIKSAQHSNAEGVELKQAEPLTEDKKKSEVVDKSTNTKSPGDGQESLPSLSEPPLISHSRSPGGGISDLISAAIAVATPEGSPTRFDKEIGLPDIDDTTAEKKDDTEQPIEMAKDGSQEY